MIFFMIMSASASNSMVLTLAYPFIHPKKFQVKIDYLLIKVFDNTLGWSKPQIWLSHFSCPLPAPASPPPLLMRRSGQWKQTAWPSICGQLSIAWLVFSAVRSLAAGASGQEVDGSRGSYHNMAQGCLSWMLGLFLSDSASHYGLQKLWFQNMRLYGEQPNLGLGYGQISQKYQKIKKTPKFLPKYIYIFNVSQHFWMLCQMSYTGGKWPFMNDIFKVTFMF